MALSSALDAEGDDGAKGKAGVAVEVEVPKGDGLTLSGGFESLEGFEIAGKEKKLAGLGGSTCFEVTKVDSGDLLRVEAPGGIN